MTKLNTLISCFCLLAMQLHAQTRPTVPMEPTSSYAQSVLRDSVYDRPFFKRPMVVSIHLGTQGLGASTTVKFAPHWLARFGFSIIPIDIKNYSYSYDETKTNITANTNFFNIHLLAGWQPFKNSNWFRVMGGAAYVLNGSVTGYVSPVGDQKAGNITITQDQIGQLEATVDWKGIAPYLGISLFNSIPKHKFNVNVDLGCYYLSAPQASMAGTKLLAGNSENSSQFAENMKDYRFLPVLQINFNYKTSK